MKPIAFLALMLPVAAFAQSVAPAPTPTPPAPASQTVKVRLDTSAGPVVLELDKGRAPITTANFLRYVAAKRFDGTAFYRAVKVQPGFGLVQGGTKADPKRTLPGIAHEPTSKTGLTHKDGTVSMARGAPGTAAGDFFIAVGDMKSMDADPTQPGDNQGFAAFGRVAEGMDTVRAMLDAPTSPTEGVGIMKGQMMSPVIRIVTARVVP